MTSQNPPRESSYSSSTSNSSDEDSLLGSASPSISQIYTDAARYEKVLISCGCMMKCPRDSTSSERASECFTDRLGKDLSVASPGRGRVPQDIAKLSVSGSSFTSSDPSSEEDSFQVESPESGGETLDVDELDTRLEESRYKQDAFNRSSTSDSGESWSISATEVVDLLIEEFGPLTYEGDPNDKETLILESDSALFQDVAILGVVHLTNHRLTFHASLLDTKAQQHPSNQVIKTGTAIIHRKRFHKRRRVWMELSHDMICTYPSSREEDKIRPLRSVLLSQVKRVSPGGPEHPRLLYIFFDDLPKARTEVVEFDTEESADHWRRELQGALFIYRHSRRQTLNGSQEDESDGIRISIPLNRIISCDYEQIINAMYILTLHVQSGNTDNNDSVTTDDGKQESVIVQFVTLRKQPVWDEFGNLIKQAKAHHPSINSDSSTVFVDLGPLSFFEEEEKGYVKDTASQGSKELAIRHALALQAEPEIWFAKACSSACIVSSGYFVVSPHFIGFWSKSLTKTDTYYRLSCNSIKNVKPVSRKLGRAIGLALEIEGRRDLRFDFRNVELRDEAIRRANEAIEALRIEVAEYEASQDVAPSSSSSSTLISSGSSKLSTPTRSATGIFSPLSRTFACQVEGGLTEAQILKLPKAINIPRDSLSSLPSKHFVCLTIGSRGDVQPYIALGLALQREGHRVTIVTHEEYGDWVKGFGINHRTAGGDPGQLMKLSVDNKMFSPEFFKKSLTSFRPWLDQLLLDAWKQCQDADALLESPSAMAGVHIAEALGIPYFRTFTMPWTKTSSFPHAMLSPPVEAPSFNSASYVLFDNVLWAATSNQINRWRRQSLRIGTADMGHLAQSKITFIYNFSQAVVPKPLDWKDNVIISGYWFLDNPDLDWTPPPSLLDWMAKAKSDMKPIVYIGFGSVTVPNPRKVTKHVVNAVLKSDVRAIISKGWSSRMSKQSEPEFEIPEECYLLDKVPHDWLFPQIDAALHHGGAGTTGASLRAGIPTLIKPWFGDQYFWASRVQKLGAGLKVPSLSVHDMASALTKATSDRVMKEKAAAIGEKVRAEDGTRNAIHAIYMYFSRASQNRASLD